MITGYLLGIAVLTVATLVYLVGGVLPVVAGFIGGVLILVVVQGVHLISISRKQ